MPAEKNTYNIVTAEGILHSSKVAHVLEHLPITFNTVDQSVSQHDAFKNQKPGTMDVYHQARVIAIHPQEGQRLSNADVNRDDWDFAFRPNSFVDELLGDRVSLHPRLSTFGIQEDEQFGDEIEIDIYKLPRSHTHGGSQ